MEAGCGHFKRSSHILVTSKKNKKNGSCKNENTKHDKAKGLFFSNFTYVQF